MRPVLSDYCKGIISAIGCLTSDNGKKFTTVRSVDKWYPSLISEATGYNMYTNKMHEKQQQFIVKARNIQEKINFTDIDNASDFLRSYIELHGVVDIVKRRDKMFPRLRIFGNCEIITFINQELPALPKKIQYISNIVDGKYIGQTCALYYQSKREIIDIISWLDGSPRNEPVWEKWNMLINKK